jgi:hypothetical protein
LIPEKTFETDGPRDMREHSEPELRRRRQRQIASRSTTATMTITAMISPVLDFFGSVTFSSSLCLWSWYGDDDALRQPRSEVAEPTAQKTTGTKRES